MDASLGLMKKLQAFPQGHGGSMEMQVSFVEGCGNPLP